MCFYHFNEGWNMTGALFYATNVGLGVGYGVYNPTSVSSKIFTVVYCLIGSSFISAGGALFVTSVLERRDEIFDEVTSP